MKVKVSLAFFDANFTDERFRLRSVASLKKWVPLVAGDYEPRGTTPLLDATAHMIRHLERVWQPGCAHVGVLVDESGSMRGRETAVIDGINEFVHGLKKVKRVDSKANTLCVIVTDGYENASVEYTSEQLADMIREREADGWTFIYLGANQDAWATARATGFSGGVSGQSVNFTSSPTGVVAALRSVGSDAASYLTDTDRYAASRSDSSTRTVTEDGREIPS